MANELVTHAEQTDSPRAISVDALRGLTIACMVLVNDAEDAASAPWWLKHMPPGAEGMTLADAVVPAFLFIVGMAVPLAHRAALARGERTHSWLRHVLGRTLGLLTMGVFMMNRHANTGAHPQLWMGAMYLAFIATWCALPARGSRARPAFVTARVLGIATLCVLALCFRGPAGERMVLGPLLEPGSTLWLRHGWWEVLGQIGWAYLTTALLYVALGARQLALAIAAALLLALGPLSSEPLLSHLHASGVLERAHALLGPLYDVLAWLHGHVHFGRALGVPASMAMWGCLLGTLLLSPMPPRARARIALRWAALWLLGAGLLYPAYGVSKLSGTPSWSLLSCALMACVWALLIGVIDERGHVRWVRWLRPAAENPLLVYFLHPLARAALALTPGLAVLRAWQQDRSPMVVSVLGNVLVVALVIGLAGQLARRGVRVKL